MNTANSLETKEPTNAHQTVELIAHVQNRTSPPARGSYYTTILAKKNPRMEDP